MDISRGFILAVLIGTVVGLLMGRFRAVEHFLDLYVNSLMSAPTTAFVPVLIIWFGLGVQSRIAVVFLFAVFVDHHQHHDRRQTGRPSAA